jgi:hypothetical protein
VIGGQRGERRETSGLLKNNVSTPIISAVIFSRAVLQMQHQARSSVIRVHAKRPAAKWAKITAFLMKIPQFYPSTNREY